MLHACKTIWYCSIMWHVVVMFILKWNYNMIHLIKPHVCIALSYIMIPLHFIFCKGTNAPSCSSLFKLYTSVNKDIPPVFFFLSQSRLAVTYPISLCWSCGPKNGHFFVFFFPIRLIIMHGSQEQENKFKHNLIMQQIRGYGLIWTELDVLGYAC